MLLARRDSVPNVVIEAAARLLEAYPEISNVELLQRLALDQGAEVTALIPVTRVERLVREPAMNRIRLGRREARSSQGRSPEAPRSEAAPPRGRRRRRVTKAAPQTDLPVTASGAPLAESGTVPKPEPRAEQSAPSVQVSVPVNRLATQVIQAVDDALLEAFTLGADSASDAEVVEHFRDLDRIRARVREALETK